MKKEKKEGLKKTGLVAGVSAAGVAALTAFSPINIPKGPKHYPGPYVAQVVKITDSDTIELLVHTWPDTTVKIGVRVNGVDTPEIFRPKCDLEKIKARDASNFVKTLLPIGSTVEVTDVFTGKFGGRVVADINFSSATGMDTLAKALIRRQHAVPYFGGKKVKDWCAE